MKRHQKMTRFLWPMLAFFSAGLAQDETLRFTHLTVEDGLSQNYIRAIVRDYRGFMWFGTDNGLNRYDGNSFRIYQHDVKDSTSISDNRIACVYEDRKHRLWSGHVSGGLSLYNRDRDAFIRFIHQSQDTTSLAGTDVFSLLHDSRDVLWIGTSAGLDRFEENTGRFFHFDNGSKESAALKTTTIRSMCESRDGSLWLASTNGLFRLHPDRKTLERFLNDPRDPNSLGYNELRSVAEDAEGRIWIATYGGGLNVFDPATGTWQLYAYDPRNPDGISYNVLQAMCRDSAGTTLYIGAENGGLIILDIRTRRFRKCLPDIGDPTSITSNSIWSIYQDGRGVLWVGTFNGGINLSSPYLNRFRIYRAQPGGLNNSYILSIHEDRRGDLWIGTDGGGLNHIDRRTGKYTYYKHDPDNPSSICGDAVLCVYEDRLGQIWIGTWAAGVDRFDRNSGRFIHYRRRFLNWQQAGIQNNFTIREDRKGDLIVSSDPGLQILDRKRDIFVPFDSRYPIPDLRTTNELCLIQDRQGIFWMGGWQALRRVDPSNLSFTHFQPVSSDPNSLINGNVLCITEDSRGTLWIGTGGGLSRFIPETQSFASLTTEDGLPSNSIQAILEDSQGNLWISTMKGIAKWTGAVANPDKPAFRIYDASDGLPGDEFKYGAAFRSRSGELFFGGQRGFVSFYPERIRDNPVIPPVSITNLLIFNREAKVGEKGSPLKKPIWETQELTLSHKQSVLSFDFSALNYILPQKNQYAYRLDGFEDEWNEVGTRRTATYTNLNPGHYTLMVRGSNSDGIWNNEGTRLRIHIRPPSWKTTWFRILTALAVCAGAYLFYKWRMRSLHQRREALETEVAERTAEVEQKKNEIEESYRRLSATAKTLASHAMLVDDATSRINSAIAEVSEGAATQNESMRKTRKLIEDLGENIRQVTIEARISNQASAHTAEQVASGTEAMGSSLQGIDVIDKSVRETWSIVEELSKSTERVNDIVRFIEETASRVNVLALNALIEASQAGEAGKGFMVVAREIRNLATSTGKFTVEVAEFIHGIQKSTASIERVTKDSLEMVSTSVSKTDQGKEALKAIRNSMEREKERLSKITTHIRSMQEFSAEVERAVGAVEAVSEKNKHTAEQISSKTQDMKRLVEELAEIARSLVTTA
jgi:methyl-accepting chemotaxis protein/ligand-binding sensor domain-containing protein